MKCTILLLHTAVLWLACCQTRLLPSQAEPLPFRSAFSRRRSLSSARVPLVDPSGGINEELENIGGLRVEDVFLHRFSRAIDNSTIRNNLQAALDIVLTSPEQLRSTFNHAPLGAQLLHDAVSGSPAAMQAVQAARSLSKDCKDSNPLVVSSVIDLLRQMADQLAQLSPGSCHPITRRIVLAALVQLQLRLHSSGQPAEEQALRTEPDAQRLLFRIYLLLFNSHRRGAAAKGAIEFLHVSKSGGTSMCSVADRNGCKAESTTNYGNCMVRRFDDRPRWVSTAVHNLTSPAKKWKWYYRYLVRRGERTCEYRDEYVQRKHFTFYSNEFAAHGGLEFNGGPSPAAGHFGPGSSTASDSGSSSRTSPPWSSAHLCSQFLNVVMLRHPIARLVSHVRWIIKVYRAEFGRTYEVFFRGRDADYWREFAPAAVDNYYIRLLLGESVFYVRTGGINATHRAAAQLVLLQYDVVLLLEAPDMDDLWLRMALGWRAGLSSARARVAGSHRAANEVVPYDMDELMAANDEDVALYEFGAALHQLDGLMFAAVAAAGVEPYTGYQGFDPRDTRLGTRVRCGYVTRRHQFLAGAGVNATAFVRKYDMEFPRIVSADEVVRSDSSSPSSSSSSSSAAAAAEDEEEDALKGRLRLRTRVRGRSAVASRHV